MALDLSNVNSLMDNLLGMFKVPQIKTPNIPTRLVIASKGRSGMSANEIGAEIIRRRAEAGLPVGLLPNGDVNPDEMMEIIRAEVYLEAISTKARTTVAIMPGIKIIGYGQTGTGQPVTVQGRTVDFGTGYGIIQ